MYRSDESIDGGKPFDWGRTSGDYARFRDVYPEQFYEMITGRGLCVGGQRVLDIGTGTGVIPRNMYRFGARWTGADASENQIARARELSRGMDIAYYAVPAEELEFPDGAFDVVTACQCFWYFDHALLMPRLYRMLAPGGRILVLYMAWLPYEDAVAGESESLVLKYNPGWTGAGETVRPIPIPECYGERFDVVCRDEFRLSVRFTRESWHGRMKSCRGIGASLTDAEIGAWEREHKKLLREIAPEEFDVLHYAAFAELKKRGGE